MNTEKPFLQFETPEFTTFDIDSAIKEGRIDENDARFLQNILNEFIGDPNILKEVYLFRNRLNHALQPGRELYLKMQSLRCRNYPLTDLDLTGYELPTIQLRDAQIGGNLLMDHTKIRERVIMIDAKIAGNMDQSHVEIGGDLNQRGINIGEHLGQYDMKIGGALIQEDAKILIARQSGEIKRGVDQSNATFGSLNQIGLKINGLTSFGGRVGRRHFNASLNQSGTKFGHLSQTGLKTHSGVNQADIKVDGYFYQDECSFNGEVSQRRAEIKEYFYQRDSHINGDLDQREMRIGEEFKQDGIQVEGEMLQRGLRKDLKKRKGKKRGKRMGHIVEVKLPAD